MYFKKQNTQKKTEKKEKRKKQRFDKNKMRDDKPGYQVSPFAE